MQPPYHVLQLDPPTLSELYPPCDEGVNPSRAAPCCLADQLSCPEGCQAECVPSTDRRTESCTARKGESDVPGCFEYQYTRQCDPMQGVKLAGLVVNAVVGAAGVGLWWFLLECYNSRVGWQMQAACDDIALGPAMKGTRWRYSEFTEGCGQHKRFYKFVAVTTFTTGRVG